GVGVTLLEAQARGNVEESGKADATVDHKSRELDTCSRQPTLQDLVHEPLRHRQIVERVAQTLSRRLWQRFRPNFGGRLYRIMIDVVEVERKRFLVERFPGVVIHPLTRIRRSKRRWQFRSQGLRVWRGAVSRAVVLRR